MAVRLLMRVDVVHSFGVPTVTTGFQNRDMKLYFGVIICCQSCDLKGSDTGAVLWCAVLGKTEEAITKLQDPSGGTCAAHVVSDQRALRMLVPWAK